MDRRSVLKNLTILAGGVFLFPSCLKQEDGKASIKLKKMHINADQENLLGDVVETIIPKTDSPGAKALNVHLFVLKMLDDCHKKEDQDVFIKGLFQLDEKSKKEYNKSFSALNQKDKEALLTAVEMNKKDQPQLTAAYQMIKQLTVEGYTISKYVMTNKLPYELVPGRYSGYFPVKNLKTAVKNG